MNPFEIIITVLVYLGIGIYIAQESEIRVPAHYNIVVLFWPIILVIGFFIWYE